MARIIKVISMSGEDWKIPFNFALVLHIAVLLGSLYLPGIFRDKPRFDKIYTIDLINVELPQQQTPPPSAPISKPEPKAVSIAPTKPQPEPIVKKAPISIKPSKRKKIVQQKTDNSAELRRLEEIKKQRELEAARLEREAKVAADLATSQAVDRLKQMLRESNLQRPSDQPGNANPANRGSRSALEGQYFASVFNTLQPLWQLPKTQIWKSDLVATVIIHVTANGEVTKIIFEKRSGNRLFDQFVIKTIQAGTPLPAIPKAMNRSSLEIGLHFKPDTIQ